MLPKGLFSKLLITLPIIVISFFYQSCTRKQIEEKVVGPNEYVVAFTSGGISSKSPLTLVLDLPDSKKGIEDVAPAEDVFELKPKVAGKTYWSGPGALSFEPDSPFESGNTYQVQVDLNKLLGFQDGQDRLFQFYFHVIPLYYKVELDQMRPYDVNNPEKNYLTGKLISSDAVNIKKLARFLDATQQNRPLEIAWLGETEKNTFQFVIDSVIRLDEESNVFVRWNGGENVTGFNDDKELILEIPANNHFKLMNAAVVAEPDQYIALSFSNPVDQKQDLEGLIYFSDNTSFRLKRDGNSLLIYPDSRLSGEKTLVIKREIRSSKDVRLENDILQKVYFGQINPEVRFIGEETIIPGDEKWLVPFEAVNLKEVDVLVYKIYANNIQQFLQINSLAGSSQISRVGELIKMENIQLIDATKLSSSVWNSYAINLADMIVREPGAIYRIELRFKKEYAIYECKAGEVGDVDFVGDGYDYYDEYTENERYYLNEYYYPDGFRWEMRDDPCHNSYYYYEHFVKKNVMASNIGLTVKEGKDQMLVFVNNLLDAKPMNNVEVNIYDYRQQKIGGGYTSPKGVANVRYDGTPYLMVATIDNQFAYQKLDAGSSLSYSTFETGGTYTQDGLKAFIYGDRGVWRPGDSLYLTAILSQTAHALPADHPVTMHLYNPRGKLIQSKTANKGVNNFYTFVMATHEDALTGVWRATLEIGESSFSQNLRIENIKPNRLKIELDLNKKILTTLDNVAKLKVRWLHGGIAAGLKANVNITLKQTKTTFEGYEKFQFEDPARYFSPEEKTLFEGELNANGEKSVPFNLPECKWAPGMLQVSFATRVFEHGGDFSIDQISSKYSPFNTYIGIAAPDQTSEWDQLDTDVDHEFEVVTLDKKGNPVSLDDLEFEVYKLDWSWWYGSDSRNLASYISTNYDRKVLQGKLRTVNGKGKFTIQIKYPNWGRYYVRVINPNGDHQTGMQIYIDWPSWYSRDKRETQGSADVLALSTSKDKYLTGEEVSVSVPTPKGANLIISLEKGSEQLRHWQMVADEKETVVKFEATPAMAPNIYLFVSVIQPHSQTANDLPVRMYGVVPVFVEDPTTVLKPTIKVPETIRPNEDYTIEVSEAGGKEMTYTIAVVDEGLLDLTHFQTPQPHKYFYAKEALAINTWDIYSDVLGAFGGRLQKVFAIGGDMESAASPENKKANRFKPVVSFIGPFILEKGKSARHQLKMPNYIGSVKCMIVAGDKGAYGHADKSIAVKQPLMVLATLPRMLAPGESVKLPVSVFVLDDKIKEVTVKVSTNSLMETKIPEKTLSVDGVGEHMVYFDINVLEKQGIAAVKVTAKHGNEIASDQVELTVRNPNSPQFDVSYYIVNPGEKWNSEVKPLGIEGTNSCNLNVSGIPPLNLEKRIRYLIRYPYGCIEQTTSSVFPQLFLSQLMKLDPAMEKEIYQNITSAITRLYGFQLSSGGFSYWPGQSGVNDWGTSYAGHFLLLAKEKGYTVPSAMLNNWVAYQQKTANDWRPEMGDKLSQAYRLYTLALAAKPNIGAMNRMREDNSLSAVEKSRLAAAYALAGRNDVAEQLLKNLTYQPSESDRNWRYNFGSEIRDQAMILETFVLIGNEDQAIPLFQQISDALKKQSWMSTQTTAYALYAASLFISDDEKNNKNAFVYKWNNDPPLEIRTEKPVYQSEINLDETGIIQIENISDGKLFVTFTNSGVPPLGPVLQTSNNLKMKIVYKNMAGQLIDIKNLPHGLDFYAEVTVTNSNLFGYIEHMALSFLAPSGWEIINTRLLDMGGSLESDRADFIDFKDDRVNFFFSLGKGLSKTYVVLLNASYSGKYFLPATQCADMYNHDVSANSGGGWVTVNE